jgi:hypothetical protein
MNPLEQVQAFADAVSLEDKWLCARDLMSTKAKPNGEEFYSFLKKGFEDLGQIAKSSDDSGRLVAVDLLVRLPASMKNNKRVQTLALEVRRKVLSAPIPMLLVISETKTLPGNGKPAEVRENVAESLKDASGEWVCPYLFRALAGEDRSQRCRLALAKEIAAREHSIDGWLEHLLDEPALGTDRDLDGAVARLRDLCAALVEAIKTKRSRLYVTPMAGSLLAKLIRTMVSIAPTQALPKGLDSAACAAVELLNEILAVRLTIMDEPELYDLVQIIHRWWSPRSYPESVAAALDLIIDKLLAGLVFRARGGQRSELLLQRLKQAINSEERYKLRMSEILESEIGLSGDVQDWLRGLDRGTNKLAPASTLSAVGTESFVKHLAEIFRLAADEEITSKDQLQSAVRSIANQYGLTVVGKEGDVVEYSPNTYDLPPGEFPKERSIRIVRSPIVRRRRDGGSDIILKGLASII